MRPYFLILILIPTLAFTQTIYRCPDSSGALKLQQLPCDNGKEVTIKPLMNGKGSNLSEMMDYANRKKEEQDGLKAEQKKIEQEKNTKRAIEKTVREQGIIDGKTFSERNVDCHTLRGNLKQNCWQDYIDHGR